MDTYLSNRNNNLHTDHAVGRNGLRLFLLSVMKFNFFSYQVSKRLGMVAICRRRSILIIFKEVTTMESKNRNTNETHSRLYMLDGKKVGKCESLAQWHDWSDRCDIADRRVARTEKDGVCVSTVFTGFDDDTGFRPPALKEFYESFPMVFETAIFKDGSIMDRWSYCTWKEAEEGHREICKNAGV